MLYITFQIDPHGNIGRIAEQPPVTRLEVDNSIYARDSTWIQHLTVVTDGSDARPALPGVEVIDATQAPHDGGTYYVIGKVAESDPYIVPLIGDHEGVPKRISVVDDCQNVELYIRDWERFYELEEEIRQNYRGFRLLSTTQVPRCGYSLGHENLKRVARRELTSSQFEALETAYRMGYFDTPQQVTSTEVARAIGISQSTFSKRVHAAQECIFDLVFHPRVACRPSRPRK